MPSSSRKGSTPVIIFLGAPGCGKGTQAQLLSDTHGLYLLDTSRILEAKFKNAKKEEFVKAEGQKYYVKDEEEIWKEGKLCSPPFVAHVLREEVRRLYKRGERLVFSGSPRTLYEAEQLIPLLTSLYGKKNIKVIFLDLSVKESIRRNSNRKICALMRHSILHTKETELLKKCPLDGSKLVRRKSLDDPETIKVRWKEFRERTLPVIDYMKRSGINVVTLDGGKSPEQVFRKVSDALKLS